ncbi:DUF58 domain-containing protein [Labilibaculum sp. DW002]|uniref:DUF58 domain-containing protein n=1 Tax=Paralabilibaculum antarcticum TaxID=2912572 RepID=A0ABT5VSM1_9BACT|nr:DUF58 domain-containing protein [Labilibaculum sp. DW002]MDE5418403.1 DUF58 domain-containing protein [Labilibaculum sp. DW002]
MKQLSDLIEFEAFDNLELMAKQIVEGFLLGLHRSPYHGFSVEFAEHRLYNKGESTKHVDWKLYARSDKLFVKQYEEETNLRAHMVIDTSSSMLFPYQDKKLSKMAFSVLCSAAMIHLLRNQRDAVGLSTFSDEIELLTPAKLSTSHAQLMYATLNKVYHQEEIGKNRQTKISDTLHQLAEGLHKRSLVIIFSDFIGEESPKEILESLQHLRFNKHEVLLFSIRDKQFENEFDFANRPSQFIDLETGESIKLNPSEIRDLYRKKQEEFFTELELLCGQFSIDYAEADIREDFSRVLQAYLLKRKKMM